MNKESGFDITGICSKGNVFRGHLSPRGGRIFCEGCRGAMVVNQDEKETETECAVPELLVILCGQKGNKEFW